MRASGFVLAGGRSTRMGRNKALLPFRGMTLVEHMAGIVRQAAGAVTLIGDPTELGHLGLPVVADQLPDRGPAGGIHAALTVSPSEWNLIAGCDMPAITSEILNDLLERTARTSADCVAAAGPGGGLEPLCAVYHRRCLAAVDTAIRENRLKMKYLLRELGAEACPVPAAAVINVNTPAEWAEFEAKLVREEKLV
ncbi:MAG TPA: molybdenum cofactor guanylyltransferase [Bryobacteraceae bacterium]|nr:molybdenum cofactor guanylyltransferase [Bryobacteraceae bacterium]